MDGKGVDGLANSALKIVSFPSVSFVSSVSMGQKGKVQLRQQAVEKSNGKCNKAGEDVNAHSHLSLKRRQGR